MHLYVHPSWFSPEIHQRTIEVLAEAYMVLGSFLCAWDPFYAPVRITGHIMGTPLTDGIQRCVRSLGQTVFIGSSWTLLECIIFRQKCDSQIVKSPQALLNYDPWIFKNWPNKLCSLCKSNSFYRILMKLCLYLILAVTVSIDESKRVLSGIE